MRSCGVIFDMDGVLVDSYQQHYESWRTIMRARGLELAEEDFATTFGRTSRDIIRRFWGDQFSEAQVAALDDEKEETYRSIIHRDFPEMDGVSDLIDALHGAGFALAIGSSGPPESVAVVRERLRAGRWIDATVSRADVTLGKPDPAIFLTAARKLGIEPTRCAVIEDAPVGLEAARRAGMTAIAITGTAPRDALAERAHLVVDSLRELTPARIAGLIDGNGKERQVS